MAKLGLMYSTHNFFHHHSSEQHQGPDKDCDGTCTLIIDAEKSEKSSDTKSFKISIDSFSSHVLSYFVFTPQIPDENFSTQNIIESPPRFIKLATPPPKI